MAYFSRTLKSTLISFPNDSRMYFLVGTLSPDHLRSHSCLQSGLWQDPGNHICPEAWALSRAVLRSQQGKWSLYVYSGIYELADGGKQTTQFWGRIPPLPCCLTCSESEWFSARRTGIPQCHSPLWHGTAETRRWWAAYSSCESSHGSSRQRCLYRPCYNPPTPGQNRESSAQRFNSLPLLPAIINTWAAHTHLIVPFVHSS